MYELNDQELAAEIFKKWKKARSAHYDWRTGAKEDFNFVAGKQWDDSDVTKLQGENRPVITFNRCNAVLSAVLGLEANQRQQVKYGPRENGDTKFADAVDSAIDWVRDYGSMEVEEAQVFENMLTCGMGWSETRMEYDTDPDGKILQEIVSSFEMEWDESSRKRNLEDARWVCRHKRMAKEEIKENWPDSEIALTAEMLTDEDNSTTVDTSSPDRYSKDDSKKGQSSNDPIVLQYCWYENEKVYRVANPLNGQIEELDEEKYAEGKEMLEATGVKVVPQKRRVYYHAFVTGNVFLEKAKSPCQTGFVFKCVTGKRDEVANEWYGIVRFMKDPQRWANKFFSTFIDILDSNAKGGLLIEEGAVSDVRKFEENYARADSVMWLRQGSIQNGRVIPKPAPPYPQTVDKLLQFAIQSIYDVTGVNLEMLGMADRAQPGIVEESRKRSAYTILGQFFDNMRIYRKTTGILLLEYVKLYVPEQRLAEVLEPELVMLVPKIKAIDLRQVNVTVSESPQSDNNKMIVWQFISQIVPALVKMGIPVPPEILEYSPLPATLVEKWKQLINPKGGSPEQQMAQMKQQMDQMKEALMQFKQENEQLRSQQELKFAELANKKELSAAELQLEREKAQAEFDLERERVNRELEIKLMEVKSNQTLQFAKAASDADVKRKSAEASSGADR